MNQYFENRIIIVMNFQSISYAFIDY